ncbi:P-loop containing nucleoside triphosphate hydrolase protein, partial [Rozella allomycis CSF55]
AYGQTASGKSYTMSGHQTEPGVIPRAIDQVFRLIEESNEDKEYLLRVSFLEIYNETIRDLLAPEQRDIRICEDRKRGIYLSPLKEEIVTCREHVMSVINNGETNRHISETDFNTYSSRSHTIFQMVIESRDRSHIPFRDSKLTRILQPSLTGNAKVAIICTISPVYENLEETINTLKFASRVKRITLKPELYEVMDEKALLQKYKAEIEELKEKLRLTNLHYEIQREQEQSQLYQEKQKIEEEMQEQQLLRTAFKERIDHLAKLILTSNTGKKSQVQSPSLLSPTSSSLNVNNILVENSELKARIAILEKKEEMFEQSEKIENEYEKLRVAYANLEEQMLTQTEQLLKTLSEKDQRISELENLKQTDTTLVAQIEEYSRMVKDLNDRLQEERLLRCDMETIYSDQIKDLTTRLALLKSAASLNKWEVE